MLGNYIVFGVSITFISWIAGMIINALLMKFTVYQQLSHFNFIPDPTVNKKIGIHYFKWIVKNTFFKFFNPNLKVKNKSTDLVEIRKQMTIAEISHLIGFLCVVLVTIYMGIAKSWLLALVITLANVLLNLYPTLLQQANKRRIDRVLTRRA